MRMGLASSGPSAASVCQSSIPSSDSASPAISPAVTVVREVRFDHGHRGVLGQPHWVADVEVVAVGMISARAPSTPARSPRASFHQAMQSANSSNWIGAVLV